MIASKTNNPILPNNSELSCNCINTKIKRYKRDNMNEKINTILHFLKMELLYHPISNTVAADAIRYAMENATYSEIDSSKV
jgi:hypothetical protein